MGKELFKVETLKHIQSRLDYIYSTAKTHHQHQPHLMDAIASLAKIANMFAKTKIEELNGKIETASPQGYIVSKLGNAYLAIKEFEKQQEDPFPEWKL